MTDGRTRMVHLITDADAAAGRASGGRYLAVCGAIVVAGALATPDGEDCRSCTAWVRDKGGR